MPDALDRNRWSQPLDAEEWMKRFGIWFVPEPNTGCWLWVRCTNRLGYGQLGANKKRRYAHQLSYELLRGPVPDGLELDHLCRQPSCVNPDHLEPVTHNENMRRYGNRLTHCPSGHPFTPENTRLNSGSKICRKCHCEREKRKYWLKKFREIGARLA